MFEKEAEEYAEAFVSRGVAEASFYKGAEFGYNKAFVEADKNLKAVVADFNKANEWHYIQDGLPAKEKYVLIYTNVENVYIARLVKDNYFIIKKGGFVLTSAVISWKEIVLPKAIKEKYKNGVTREILEEMF